MQTLSEHLTFDQAQMVIESSKEGKDLYMKGICIQGNVKNANQRVYPTYEITEQYPNYPIKSLGAKVSSAKLTTQKI